MGLPPAYGLTVAAVSVAGMGLGAQLVAAFSEAHRYELNVAAVSKREWELGAQLVAAFSEAHRYELNVAAISKAGMGLGAQLVAAFSEVHRYPQCRRFQSGNVNWGSTCLSRFSGAQICNNSVAISIAELGLLAQLVDTFLKAHRYVGTECSAVSKAGM